MLHCKDINIITYRQTNIVIFATLSKNIGKNRKYTLQYFELFHYLGVLKASVSIFRGISLPQGGIYMIVCLCLKRLSSSMIASYSS